MASDYISELAARAYQEITKPGLQAKEILDCLHEKPTSAADLEQQLASLPAIQAQIAWYLHYTPSKWLLERELEMVGKRREKMGIGSVEPGQDAYDRAGKSGLMGLCFSGGGIRSATFNLGILQGLAELKLLRCFDYLSTVSGGGYIHQWLAAWGRRQGFDNVTQQLIPLPEKDSPPSHPEPLRWLRRYSNYLTPERGFFTADTWVVAATWLRNTLLNQIILITTLLAVLLLPHALALHQIGRGIWAAVVVGMIVYFFFVAAVLIGRNLFRFDLLPVRENRLFGQRGVQLGIVLPLLICSLLFALMFPIRSEFLFAFHLLISFLVGWGLLSVLTLTTIFAGKVPLCYLQSHHQTRYFKSFGEFWRQKPWCRAHLKAAFAVLGMIAAALLAAACGALWIVLTDYWMAQLWSRSGKYWWRLTLVIDPPLILAGALLALLILTGLLGRLSDDRRREWLVRLAAWIGLYFAMWLIFVGISLFGSLALAWLACHIKIMIGSAVVWAGSTLGGVLAGKSTRSAGPKDDQSPSPFNPLEILAVVGPYVFVAGLLLLLSALAEALTRGHGLLGTLIIILVVVAVCLLFALRVDINEFSMHAFYRDRLARCYQGATTPDRDPNPFTGFDPRDSEIAVSDLQPPYYYGPFPIFCTTLNLTFGEDLAWQERKAASFAFTPLYSGYDVGWTAARGKTLLRYNGFVKTEEYAYPKPGIHVSTVAAISGAGVSPNWGFHTNPATAFLLTVFNVRLGWWLTNPRALDEEGRLLTEQEADAPHVRRSFPSPSPRFSLLYLVSELLGAANDTRRYVNLTDGGHFDNMGLYELVRRRCRYIVICDAESDANLRFEGIGMSIRKCRIDFGAEVALDLRPLEHLDGSSSSAAHCVVGTIRYAEDNTSDPHYKPGIVVYIKSSLTGDEPGDIVNYKKEHSAFPHDTTVNQWFTESQFESYRRLGHHVAISTFEPARPDSNDCRESIAKRDDYFFTLRGIWYARTPEMEKHSAEHSKRYEALLRRIREDQSLPGFFDMLFKPGAGKWETNRTATEVAHARATSSDLIEFIFLVYLDLNLVFPEKRDHPFSRGWYQIFKNWAQIDSVRAGWAVYSHGYSKSFQLFANKELGLP